MLKNKDEYYVLSRQLNLPTRCPLLDRCERRAHTLALANGWPLEQASDIAKLQKPIVSSVGEFASMIGGANNFLVSGLCPEVSLFEPSVSILGLNNAPTIQGRYDKYVTPMYEILETGHFSECAEYAKYAHDITHPQSGDYTSITANALPEKITLPWLVHNVPIHLWISAVAVLGSVFLLGVHSTRIGLVREVFGLENITTRPNQVVEQPLSPGPNTSLKRTATGKPVSAP